MGRYRIVGTGPYRIAEITADQKWLLRRRLFASRAAAEVEVDRLTAGGDR